MRWLSDGEEVYARAIRRHTSLDLAPLEIHHIGLEEIARRPQTVVVALSAKIEAEIAELDAEDARAFMADLGIGEPALDRVIRASYHLLGCLSFFTVGADECRAWSIRTETPAVEAGGVIHSDIQRGFIRAEVLTYRDLMAAGSYAAARKLGTVRLEGKDYEVHDGDILHVRFNV